MTEILARDAPGRLMEIWFQDEARVGQQGTLTRVWARRGTRPRAHRGQRRTSAYLFGAVCPLRGTTARLVMSHGNARTLSNHLAAINAEVASGSHALLVLDGAGYHIAKRVVVPGNVSLVFLPPYAPELNPMDNVWAYLRGNKLANRVFRDDDHIVHACCDTWNFFADDAKTIASITTREWATVNV